LISNQGTSFWSMSNDFGGYTDIQPIAVLEVGGADVFMPAFGVYGAAEAAGSMRWVVFQGENPIYVSSPQTISMQGDRWYDSPGIGLTLAANQTYALGVVTSNLFAWGWNDGSNGPLVPITQNGLTLPVLTAQAQVTLDGAGHFAGDPIYVSGFESTDFQASVRVLAPIPEPAEWSMLIAGLLVIGFIARRRNQFLPDA
jgi:hypothetical protein